MFVREHETGNLEHYDIFFEMDGGNSNLLTYELAKEDWEKIQKGERVYCKRKKDHRKIYLDFEGEISGNRGIVKIVWKGFYDEKKNPESGKIRINLDKLTLVIN